MHHSREPEGQLSSLPPRTWDRICENEVLQGRADSTPSVLTPYPGSGATFCDHREEKSDSDIALHPALPEERPCPHQVVLDSTALPGPPWGGHNARNYLSRLWAPAMPGKQCLWVSQRLPQRSKHPSTRSTRLTLPHVDETQLRCCLLQEVSADCSVLG